MRTIQWRVRYFASLVTGVTILFILQSCIREDYGDCVTDGFLLTIKVVDVVTGDDITETAGLQNAVIYLFDQENSFIRSYRFTAAQIRDREPVTLPFSGRNTIGVSVWGGVDERVKVRNDGDDIEGIPDDTAILLVEDPDHPGYDLCPNDFFFGWKSVSYHNGTGIQREEVVITQKNARLNIVARGLDVLTEHYYFKMSSRYSGYNFHGAPIQMNSVVKERGTFKDGEYISPEPYVLIHSASVTATEESSLWVYLCRESSGVDIEMAALNRDTHGNYLTLFSGQTTNVLIDFNPGNSGFEVYTEVTPWNEVYQWEEF